jgi:outer membrane protein TolC
MCNSCSDPRQWHRLSIALAALALAALALPAAASDSLPPLAVGAASDLDLARLRALAGQLRGEAALAAPAPRALSLEDALRTALERNLALEIAALDAAASDPALEAQRAFFDPTTGLRVETQGRKLDPEDGDAPPRQAADYRNEYRAAAFISQQVPTGGSLRLSAGYFREDRNDPCNPGRAGDPGDCPIDAQTGQPLSVNDPSTSQGAGFLIEVRQPLLRGGRFFVARRAIRDAELDVEIERARLDAQMLDVRAQTHASYYDAILHDRLIEVIETALARDADLLRASQALFAAGSVSKRDLYSAEIRIATDRAELARRRAARELSRQQLRNVLGLPSSESVAPSEREIPFRPVPLALDEWLADARARRPELIELRKRLEKSALELRVRGNALLPELDAFGHYGRTQDLANRDWLAGVVFAIPFGNRAARSRLTQAELAHARLAREATQLERRIDSEVRESEIQLRASGERLEALAGALENARGKREVAGARFQMGAANNFDVTDADEELIRAETELLSTVAEYASQLARLEARIGRTL